MSPTLLTGIDEDLTSMAMVFSLAACVAKTFPEYFDELEKLTLRAAPPT